MKEASLKIEGVKPEWKFLEGVTLEVAVAHGLSNAQQVIAAIRSGKKEYHFVEVMTCPGGCIGGGGQPRYTNNQVREARIKAIYREDDGKKLRKSHDNPDVAKLYAEFLGQPLGEKSHHLLPRSTRPASGCKPRIRHTPCAARQTVYPAHAVCRPSNRVSGTRRVPLCSPADGKVWTERQQRHVAVCGENNGRHTACAGYSRAALGFLLQNDYDSRQGTRDMTT